VKSDGFEFDEITNMLQSTSVNKGGFDELGLFDTPQSSNVGGTSKKETTQMQGNKDKFGFGDLDFGNNNTKNNQTQKSNDLLDELANRNMPGKGMYDLFGTLQTSGGVSMIRNSDGDKKILSGTRKEEKLVKKKLSDQSTTTATTTTKTTTGGSSDAWGLGANLVNFDNLSRTTTGQSAFNPEVTKKPASGNNIMSTGGGI